MLVGLLSSLLFLSTGLLLCCCYCCCIEIDFNLARHFYRKCLPKLSERSAIYGSFSFYSYKVQLFLFEAYFLGASLPLLLPTPPFVSIKPVMLNTFFPQKFLPGVALVHGKKLLSFVIIWGE